MKTISLLSEWLSSKSLHVSNVREEVEKIESSNSVGGNALLVQPLWKTVWRVPKKLKILQSMGSQRVGHD